ncbi:MAG TPA: LysR family transcriptional regulator [Roseiarcus sp.]|jgi:DNA-binding transcriptional LysR family regulator
MDVKQLKCFAAVAEELHFGHAAQRMNMLPSALGRQIKLLEEELDTRLLVRSTRHVALTPAGAVLRHDAKSILAQLAAAELNVRRLSRSKGSALRIGAIDSAAVGLLPALLCEFKEHHPDIETRLIECTSARQLQHLLAGRLDLGFVRPPVGERGLKYEFLLYETLVVAMPGDHALAAKSWIDIHELAPMQLIVPARQVRPHSYKAVMRAFAAAGEEAKIVLEAAERQTMISLVAAGIGLAIVPSWAEKLRVPGVVYRPLRVEAPADCPESALGIAWCEELPSASRELFIDLVRSHFAKKSLLSAAVKKVRRARGPATTAHT